VQSAPTQQQDSHAGAFDAQAATSVLPEHRDAVQGGALQIFVGAGGLGAAQSPEALEFSEAQMPPSVQTLSPHREPHGPPV